jgi:hypothetical protein
LILRHASRLLFSLETYTFSYANLLLRAAYAECTRAAVEAAVTRTARLAEEARCAEKVRLFYAAYNAQEECYQEAADVAKEVRIVKSLMKLNAELCAERFAARLQEKARVSKEAREAARAKEVRLTEEVRVAEEARVAEAALAEEVCRAEEVRVADEAHVVEATNLTNLSAALVEKKTANRLRNKAKKEAKKAKKNAARVIKEDHPADAALASPPSTPLAPVVTPTVLEPVTVSELEKKGAKNVVVETSAPATTTKSIAELDPSIIHVGNAPKPQFGDGPKVEVEHSYFIAPRKSVSRYDRPASSAIDSASAPTSPNILSLILPGLTRSSSVPPSPKTPLSSTAAESSPISNDRAHDTSSPSGSADTLGTAYAGVTNPYYGYAPLEQVPTGTTGYFILPDGRYINTWQKNINNTIHIVAHQRLVDDGQFSYPVPHDVLQQHRMAEDRAFIEHVTPVEARNPAAWAVKAQMTGELMAANGHQPENIADFINKLRSHHDKMMKFIGEMERVLMDACKFRGYREGLRREANARLANQGLAYYAQGTYDKVPAVHVNGQVAIF